MPALALDLVRRAWLGGLALGLCAGLASAADPEFVPDVSFATAATNVTEAAGAVSVTVTLSTTSASNVSIPYTVGGSATAADATVAPGPLVIPAGQTQGSILVTVLEDTLSEGRERVTLTLGTPSVGSLGTQTTHEVIIEDNEPPATVSFSQASQTVSEGVGTVTLTVTLSDPRTEEARVNFSQTGTATPGGVDVLVTPPSPIVFAPGATTRNLTVTVTQDPIHEPNETLVVRLLVPNNCVLGAIQQTTVTIEDDDPPPSVSFAAPGGFVVESAAFATVPVQLSAPSSFDVTVPVATSGTATLGSDYTFSPSSLFFPAGTTTATIDVVPVNDTAPETTETIVFGFGAPTNATIGSPSTYELLLIDDDSAPPSVAFDVASSTVQESAGTLTRVVRASRYAPVPIVIPVSTSGTAQPGTDFVLNTPTLTIPVGQLTANLSVTVVDDAIPEPTESVTFTLGSPTGATLGAQPSHTLTIEDDDLGLVADFALATSTAGEGAGVVFVGVTLSAPAPSTVTIPVTFGGTATLGGVDATVTPQPLVIPTGQSAGSFQVAIVQDTLHEGPETIVMTLGTPTGAGLGTVVQHTLTIIDDDPQPTVGFPTFRFVTTEDVGTFDLEFVLSAPAGVPVTVPYTATGRASGPSDISVPPGPAVIPAGDTSVIVPVTVIQDNEFEPAEAVTFTIGAPTNAAVGPIGSYVVLITEVTNSGGITQLPNPLVPSVASLSFPLTRVGEASPPQTFQYTNVTATPLSLTDVGTLGFNPDDFVASVPSGLPTVVAPGQSVAVDVVFQPRARGMRTTRVRATQSPQGRPPVQVVCEGLALGVTGDEIRINAAETGFISPLREYWSPEYGMNGGALFAYTQPIAGTTLEGLYQTVRFGAAFTYSFEVPNGNYEVVIRGWEPLKDQPGERLIDVRLEGALALDDLDYFAEVGQNAAYTSPPLPVTVADGVLDIDFTGVVALALVSAIEVRSVADLSSPTTVLNFGTVDQGTSLSLDVEFVNNGLHTANIDRVTFATASSGDSTDFTFTGGGVTYAGGVTNIVRFPDIALPPGITAIPVTFTPTFHEDHVFTMTFESTATGDAFDVDVVATGGAEAGWGFLHPVPDTDPAFVVDYDDDGQETVALLGAESHTHEPGRTLVGYQWTVGGVPHATTVDSSAVFPLGSTEIELTITDSNVPPNSASDTRTVVVHPVDAVPGVLVDYYGGLPNPAQSLDSLPALPGFIERAAAPRVDPVSGRVGSSPFTGDAIVRMQARFQLASNRTLEFVATGGSGHRVYLDGVLVSGPQVLGLGSHEFEVRFAVEDVSELPVELTVMEGGVAATDVLVSLVHDEALVPPVIHSMPTIGTDLGGNRITIEGFGFFPRQTTVVHWGAIDITSAQFEEWSGEAITLTTPPGSGTISVTVETSKGVSNPVNYVYSPTGPIPVRFQVLSDREVTLSNVTSAAWGPDGRLYVAVIDGTLRMLSFDDQWNITGIGFSTGVSGLTNADTMALAFNPYDHYDPSNPASLKLYVAHGEQFQNGGGAFTGPSYYTGQISVLTGPNFNAPTPLITQLPVSNHDHAVNGMEFDDNGDLLICVGGNTNAGVAAPLLGDVPESPLSGAIVRARTSDPNFNGNCLYIDSSSGVFVDDQVFGEQVDLDPSVDIEVFAAGFRNSWDLVLHTNGYVYATDNGPNLGYGPGSITLTTDTGTLATRPDELNLVEKGNYYGGANRARGRYDERQVMYYPPEAPSIPEVYVRPMTQLDSSTNGITEYRATAFNSAMRGELIAMKWNFGIYRISLTDHGRRFQTKTLYQSQTNTAFPPNKGLDVVYAPGGALIAIDYSAGRVRVQVPDDVSAIGLTPYDITPWRVPAGGGQRFIIGGKNFGTNPAAVSVTIGGVPATVTAASPTRIRGIFPPSPSGAATGMLDVVVTVGATQRTIPDAMRYLPSAPGQALGTWHNGSVLPLALGEVSSCVIDGKLYVFGQGDARTMVRDLLNPSWNLGLQQRPFAGNHHALEVSDGKIYLIGGLDNGSAGRVQIYDPALDAWTLGAPMPWNGGSCATALIDGKIYVGGGNIQGGGTASNFAVYDIALNTWTPLGSMPTPVNHAASGTDGARMYVFGGRQGNNVPQPGFDDVQVYDPVTNTWETSDAGDVAAMPLPRGGTGNAVFLDGEFWIMGGEDATNAYGDVQVYDPALDTWRMDAPMPTARHGIFPTLFQGRIFVLGGGRVAGFGSSAVSEVLSPR